MYIVMKGVHHFILCKKQITKTHKTKMVNFGILQKEIYV